MPKISDADGSIDAVARSIAERDREFLYARLAVHEILASPDLVTDPRRAGDLRSLLNRDHRELFRQAVERLISRDPLCVPLLQALAHAEGRGLPRADRIWLTVANALADDSSAVTEAHIDRILSDAAPYIMLDGDDGQSVYRLAHRTFQEFFLAGETP